MSKLYFVSVNRDDGTYDDYEIEANSIEDAQMQVCELNGWVDIGECYIEEITE
jgi:hypothetical protein